MSTLTAKVVSFNIYAGSDLHKYQSAKANHMEPLDRALAGLTETVRKFVDGYHYLRARIITCQASTYHYTHAIYCSHIIYNLFEWRRDYFVQLEMLYI